MRKDRSIKVECSKSLSGISRQERQELINAVKVAVCGFFKWDKKDIQATSDLVIMDQNDIDVAVTYCADKPPDPKFCEGLAKEIAAAIGKIKFPKGRKPIQLHLNVQVISDCDVSVEIKAKMAYNACYLTKQN